MARSTVRYVLSRITRIAAGPWLGVVLVGMILLYLGAVSILTELSPRWVERVLGVPVERVYGHWLLVALGGGFYINFAAVTVRRIPFDRLHIGAWCSHLGVLVLLTAAAYYVAAGERGFCVARRGPDGWRPVRHFHIDRPGGTESRPLPGRFVVKRAEYVVYPGSNVPKDFRCWVEIITEEGKRSEKLSLNLVGRWRSCSPSPLGPAWWWYGFGGR